jgi:hypothetical protein
MRSEQRFAGYPPKGLEVTTSGLCANKALKARAELGGMPSAEEILNFDCTKQVGHLK